jgi:hypothetical protein
MQVLLLQFIVYPDWFLLFVCLAYTSVLKTEVVLFSKMSVSFCQSTQCHMPEDSTLHSHHFENLKSNNTRRDHRCRKCFQLLCVHSFHLCKKKIVKFMYWNSFLNTKQSWNMKLHTPLSCERHVRDFWGEKKFTSY